MITREDVVSAIGYDGNAALVERSARKRYGKLTTDELLELGYYRAAAASAIWAGSDAELARVADVYNRASGSTYTPDAIPRVFGVAKVTVTRVLSL
jgi:hypothetical protein